MTSKHYDKKRYKRQNLINRYINGDGHIIDSFEIDNGHKHGVEIHSITDTGLIIINNKETGKLVTKLIARPNQIERYYKDSNKHPPQCVMFLAQWHMSLGYNRR